MKATRQPNFIIIGAMKCATSSLHEQLAEQPGFFMSTPKEPNFFSNDEQYAKGTVWYDNLFSMAGEQPFIGESSTHYSKLPTYPKTLERLQNHFDTPPKIIYIIRHPIDRLVSQYIHEWTQNVIKVDINHALSLHPELISYSLYHYQISPYIEAFGKENVLLVPFSGLKQHPQKELERICNFLGYQGEAEWKTDLQQSNVSAERIRKFPLYNLMVDSAPAAFIRRTFIPQGLRDMIKRRFTMNKRPELSSENINMLEQRFNQDLAQLNALLDTDITCQNFNHATLESGLRWI